jgi:hypothetical protein
MYSFIAICENVFHAVCFKYTCTQECNNAIEYSKLLHGLLANQIAAFLFEIWQISSTYWYFKKKEFS